MNYNASMKQYLNDDINAKTTSLDPHKIIEEVLKDLKKNMETLAYSIEIKPVPITSTFFIITLYYNNQFFSNLFC